MTENDFMLATDGRAGGRLMPNLRFKAVVDGNNGPPDGSDCECLELDGVTKPSDDPFWVDHTPPLHEGCRCVLELMKEAIFTEVARSSDAQPLDEQTLDEAAARIHDRRDAFVFYANAFFRSHARWRGWDDGEAQIDHQFNLLFIASQREPAWEWQRSMEREDYRRFVDDVGERLYPGAGSGRDAAVERAYLFRPQWQIEKAGARDLVERLRLPPPPKAERKDAR